MLRTREYQHAIFPADCDRWGGKGRSHHSRAQVILLCGVNITHSATNSFSSMFEHLQWVFVLVRFIIHIQQSERHKKMLRLFKQSLSNDHVLLTELQLLIDWLILCLSVCLSVCLSGWLTGWLADRLTGWLTDWLTDWLACYERLTDLLAFLLTSWLSYHLSVCLLVWISDLLSFWLAGWEKDSWEKDSCMDKKTGTDWMTNEPSNR